MYIGIIEMEFSREYIVNLFFKVPVVFQDLEFFFFEGGFNESGTNEEEEEEGGLKDYMRTGGQVRKQGTNDNNGFLVHHLLLDTFIIPF